MLVFDLNFNTNGIVNIHRFGGELAVLLAVGLSLKVKVSHFNFVIILSANIYFVWRNMRHRRRIGILNSSFMNFS